MDLLKQYLDRAEEIIGERSQEQRRYDREVIRWLRKGKPIAKAITKANDKYPLQAMEVGNESLADVKAHYEYLAEHESIAERLNALKK